MVSFAEKYFGRESNKSPKPQEKSEADKYAEMESFIDSTGMKHWLAKIVFKEQIELILTAE